MAKQTTNPVKLKYSRPVKKGRTSSYKGREKDRQEDEFYNLQTPRGDLSKMVDGDILQKRIASYRHWFKFLKLALELEQQNAVLLVKKKKFKIKVNKSMYVGWHLDKVLKCDFDDWFFKQNHRQLFMTDILKVLKTKDKVSNDDDKVTMEFDANRRLADVIKDLRRINKEQSIFGSQSDGMKSNFVINGRVIDATLQNRYNALVLKLEGKLTNEEILTSEHQYIRATSKSKLGYKTQRESDPAFVPEYEEWEKEKEEDEEWESTVIDPFEKGEYDEPKFDIGIKGKPNWAITIFELTTGSASTYGAKQILLSVCDGYFVKHPTKTF